MSDKVWKAIFDYEGLRRRRRFSHMVDTDGTKICFHFHVTKKKDKKRKVRRSFRASKRKDQRVISIDPGRSNLIMAYDTQEEKYYRLTRGYYYRATGMKARNKRVNERNLEMKGIYEAMSRTPTKSIREEDWYRYQELIVRHYEKLWSFSATKKRRKENFRIQGQKEKCLDLFFNKFIRKGEEKPVIAYGGVTMGPTGRGELSVPVKYVYQKCEERFHTKKVDERYTTKMHCKCKGVTEEVEVDSKKQRGLRWCST